MNEPIKAGDECRVIGGLGRSKSPNLNLKVIVKHNVLGAHGADHSVHGRIVRCEGLGIKQIGDRGEYIETGWADFPVKWLEKIPPDALPPEATTAGRELTA